MSQIKAGTATVTSASTVVTGNSTAWQGNVAVGSLFKVQGELVDYVIAAVASDSETITLASAYVGTTGAKSYAIVTDFTPVSALPLIGPNDVDWAYIHSKGLNRLDSLVGMNTYGITYKGEWNPATNTPALPTAAAGNAGWRYVANAAGTHSGTAYAIGDSVISDGTTWKKYIGVAKGDQGNQGDQGEPGVPGVATLSGTSTTSNTIGTGLKTFTTQTGKDWVPGMGLMIADTSDPSTNYMTAKVVSYSGSALVVNVESAIGSGTIADWTISFASSSLTLGLGTGQAIGKSLHDGIDHTGLPGIQQSYDTPPITKISKYGTVLAATGGVGDPDRYGVCAGTNIVKIGSTYFMFYNGKAATGSDPWAVNGYFKTCLASSTDLINWTRLGNVIPTPTTLDGSAAAWNWVWADDLYLDGGTYYLLCTGPLQDRTNQYTTEKNPKVYYTNTGTDLTTGWSGPFTQYDATAIGLPNICGNKSVIKDGSTYYITCSNIPDAASKVWQSKITMLSSSGMTSGWSILDDVLDFDDPRWAGTEMSNTFFDSKIFKAGAYFIIYVGCCGYPAEWAVTPGPATMFGPTGRYFFSKSIEGPYYTLPDPLFYNDTANEYEPGGRSSHYIVNNEIWSYVDLIDRATGSSFLVLYTNQINAENDLTTKSITLKKPDASALTNVESKFTNPAVLSNLSSPSLYPTSGTNVGVTMNIIPKGTGYAAGLKSQISVYNTDFVADSSNYENLAIKAGGTKFVIDAAKTGAGTYRPLVFGAGGVNGFAITETGGAFVGQYTPGSSPNPGNGNLHVTGEVYAASLQIDHATAQDGYVWTCTDADGNGQWEEGGNGFVWSYSYNTSFTAAVDHGYIVSGTGQTITIPNGTEDGQTIKVAVHNYYSPSSVTLSFTTASSLIPTTLNQGESIEIVWVTTSTGGIWCLTENQPGSSMTQSAILALLDDETDTPMIVQAATNTTEILQVKNTSGTKEFSVTGNGDVFGTSFTIDSAATDADTKIYDTSSLANLGIPVLYPVSGTNVGVSFGVCPKGTGFSASIVSQLSVYNTDYVADSTNYEQLVFRAAGSSGFQVIANKGGTGTYRPITFKTNNADILTLDTTGEIKINGVNSVGDSGITPDGGFYTCYYAAETLAKGDIVYFAQSGTNQHVSKAVTGASATQMPVGIVYEAVTYTADNTNVVKVIWGGRAEVLWDTGGTTPAKGYVAYVSSRVGASNGTFNCANTPSTGDHWAEIGHITSATSPGSNRYWVQLHFN